ncbi:hypothetical protein ACP4OV_031867 [Aristida adscensionis]
MAATTTMPARPLSPALLVFLAAAVVLAGGHHAALASSVEDTCAKACGTPGPDVPANLESFCVASLQAAPGSNGADARGLATVATNLTLANYTAAVATIKKLEKSGGWTAPAMGALATCRRRYIEALNVVHSCVHALAVRKYEDYVADMGVVRSAPVDCKKAFGSGGGGNGVGKAAASPADEMRKVNEDAMLLATVGIQIVKSL